MGSGRSGTRMVYKLLSGNPQIDVYHEYLCTHIQQVSAKYYMGILTKSQVKKEIMKLHGSAIYYSKADYWVDSSNKLSWVIEPLYELFPNAKFVHLVRDGRKVVSSFFHKLSPEIYDDESVNVLTNWLKNQKKVPEPPPEKKYWWNIPQKGQMFYKEFPTFNQFQRICYHWVEVTRVITESFVRIPKKQYIEVKLEDLTTNKKTLERFLSFFDVPYEDHFFEFVKRPQGVFFPMDFNFTKVETQQFKIIAQKTMKKFEYKDNKIYKVRY